METSKIVLANNKALEHQLLKSIDKLPNHVIKTTCCNDLTFLEPINDLTKHQKDNLKNLLHEI
jgi:hypothetical protein